MNIYIYIYYMIYSIYFIVYMRCIHIYIFIKYNVYIYDLFLYIIYIYIYKYVIYIIYIQYIYCLFGGSYAAFWLLFHRGPCPASLFAIPPTGSFIAGGSSNDKKRLGPWLFRGFVGD